MPKESEEEKKLRKALEAEAAKRDKEIKDAEALAKIRERTKAAEEGNGKKK
jgi:hypothetical protein